MVHIYPGAIHIHSVHSDGTGTIEEIAYAAKRAGLSWIVVTDHNNMNGKEGMYHGVCVIVGKEISPDNDNHYIAIDVKEHVSHEQHPAEFVRKVREQGGFGFIAHPDEMVERKNSYPALRWTDWSMKDFGGIEIWNYMSDWVDYYNAEDPLETLKAILFRNHILKGPSENTLKWWDSLNLDNPDIVPAIGGVDVHAMEFQKSFVKLKIFPYKDTFGTITNFLHFQEELPEDFEGKKRQILDALKFGQNLIANRVWANKCKYPIYCIQNEERRVYSGGSIELDSYTKLLVKLPKKADVRLFYDGQLVWQAETHNLEFDKLDRGKYRVEAYYKSKPWIFSNPILIK